MKTIKLINVIIALGIIAAFVIAVSSIETANGFGNSGSESSVFPEKLEIFSGSTEFYFKPANDPRMWHVVNKYVPLASDSGLEYNNSSYIFTFDSVSVVNEYVGIPIAAQMNLIDNTILNNIQY